MKKIIINGKFMSQNVTGVQRYAREILSEMDAVVQPGVEIILACDRNAVNVGKYRNIRIERVGRLTGNLWEQISLPAFVIRNRAVCVSLCNMAPVLTPHIVAIHDVSFRVNKDFFSRKFSLWYGLVFSLIIRRIKQIVTVSDFSRSEICRAYGRDFPNITVTYNGWQHFRRVVSDNNAVSKYGLIPGEYFFSMSSMAPNKNFRWIASAACHNPDVTFAVSGAVNTKVFGDIFDFEIPQNLKFLGYVTDEEAKALMGDCKLFLFPTYYEGFGIPPLEALSVGARAAVSDRSCMREIFGGSVYYIDPDDPETDLNGLLASPVDPPQPVLEKYSWRKSAEILYNTILKEIS